MNSYIRFDESETLKNLKHYLPAQAPLKDFVHHNTLHAFQNLNFHEGLSRAFHLFGYNVYLSFSEYQTLYKLGKIDKEIIIDIIEKKYGKNQSDHYLKALLDINNTQINVPVVGRLRSKWKEIYQLDINARVHSNLFRLLGSFLDQGITNWKFPHGEKSFLNALRDLDKNSFRSFLKTQVARDLLHNENIQLHQLLQLIVGEEKLFETYLFDQQFEHPGWSGIVAAIEQNPTTLLDQRKISLRETIHLELILEIDTLQHRFGSNWKALALREKSVDPIDIHTTVVNEHLQLLAIWQEAFEWTYYDEVLKGIQENKNQKDSLSSKKFQAVFCIDDREFSLRQYLEQNEASCETFSTAGHFGIDAFYQPLNAKFHTKICPLPIQPKHLIQEKSTNNKLSKDIHFSKTTSGILSGWMISQTVGFWSALKLASNIFRPDFSAATASSFQHMNADSELTVEAKNIPDEIQSLQVGYTVNEMTDRVESVLKGMGLTKNFADLVYVIGHGASSTNNPHFAAYDCGACSGRPGSVNARFFSLMANHHEVRKLLSERGIHLQENVRFIGGLHDTTRDEIIFYDLNFLSAEQKQFHEENVSIFKRALSQNAKERARRFDLISSEKISINKTHQAVKSRSVSLFEPRPEYNHATNSLCIVGRRSLTKNLFLDRRAFLNSYDFSQDPEGKMLLGILNAVTPVCGGINLEYYFSRTDNQKLGAGSKLPHNVMGLIGVANGIEGDLRPGLPAQMIEIHDPIRLLIIVEHFPEVVLKVIQSNSSTYEWVKNEWVNLVVYHPVENNFKRFNQGNFEDYFPHKEAIPTIENYETVLQSTNENLSVFKISN